MASMSYTKTHDRKLMFTCRAGVLLAAAMIVSACDRTPTSSSSTGLFDDFSADMIDHTKWANTGIERRVENGKFVSAVRSGPHFLDSTLRSYFPRHQPTSGSLIDS